MKSRAIFIHPFAGFILFLTTAGIAPLCTAQDNMPSFFTGMLAPDTTTPVHTDSLN